MIRITPNMAASAIRRTSSLRRHAAHHQRSTGTTSVRSLCDLVSIGDGYVPIPPNMAPRSSMEAVGCI